MKKYIGIIRLNNFNGVNDKIICKMYDDISDIVKWINHYKDDLSYLILDNTEELNNFFEPFIDLLPITDLEINEKEKGRKLYKKLMNS